MAKLNGIIDKGKREKITFECYKDTDCSYANVLRLIKAAYGEVGKSNPFDPAHKDALKITLPGASKMTKGEWIRQLLTNVHQTFLTLVQAMRSLKTSRHLCFDQPNHLYPGRVCSSPKSWRLVIMRLLSQYRWATLYLPKLISRLDNDNNSALHGGKRIHSMIHYSTWMAYVSLAFVLTL